MQKYTDVVTSARSGAAIPSARVTVKTSPGGVTATIYSDDGVTPEDNPLTTDSNGEFTFYAADGEYTLTVSGTGITERTVGPIILHDPADSDAYMPSTDVSFTQSGTITATTVQGAIEELDGDITAHTGDASGAHAASAIAFTPAGGIAATDVQAAIEEVASESSGIPATTIDAKGDLLVGTAADTVARKAAGTNDHVLTAASGETDGLAWRAVPLPRSYLAGFTLSNNGTDATNDIDIAAGAARDSTNAANIIGTAMTKRLDAGWVAGTNQGVRNSAAAITDTTYHIYAVAKALGADPDYYAHASAVPATVLAALQAEAGGADYIYARRIGSIRRESAAIVAFSQLGDQFLRNAAILDVDTTDPGTAAVTRTLSVPDGVKVNAMINVVHSSGTTYSEAYVSSLDASDQAPSLTAAPLANVSARETTGSITGAAQLLVRTNASRQIRSRQSTSGGGSVFRIATLGWMDRRGKDD